MPIRVERDGAFWAAVATHPAVTGGLLGMTPEQVAAFVGRADALPLAADHGGFIFVQRDPMGFVAELHTLFTPQGWGREAHDAGREALDALWERGFQTLVTFETAASRRSRPPLSFGFRPAGGWRATPFGALRQWTLTQQGWAASPAAQRRSSQCP